MHINARTDARSHAHTHTHAGHSDVVEYLIQRGLQLPFPAALGKRIEWLEQIGQTDGDMVELLEGVFGVQELQQQPQPRQQQGECLDAENSGHVGAVDPATVDCNTGTDTASTGTTAHPTNDGVQRTGAQAVAADPRCRDPGVLATTSVSKLANLLGYCGFVYVSPGFYPPEYVADLYNAVTQYGGGGSSGVVKEHPDAFRGYAGGGRRDIIPAFEGRCTRIVSWSASA